MTSTHKSSTTPAHQPIIIVQGGQYGSEAKGMVTAAICSHRPVSFCVRTGAINAGHTVIHAGVEFKMQQIPCGFVNPNTVLVIGAGAMIHPGILAAEIDHLNQVLGTDIRDRLLIDYRAGIHLDAHAQRARSAGRHHKMGATGKGCSEALVAKISQRGDDCVLTFKEWLRSWGGPHTDDMADVFSGLRFIDTEFILNQAYDNGLLILLEGTQGTHLDMHLGPYPYTTHKQTIAGQWALESGLSPALDYEVILVCRTYPIRVAGNSGPMPNEISWPTLARRINHKLINRSLPPMVSDDAIVEFETALATIAWSKYADSMPRLHDGRPNVQQETWTANERRTYRHALSELNKDALLLVSPASLAELCKLFEMTTVTRKLRRLSDLDIDTLRASVRQNRPTHVVLTFLNYEFPQFWGEENDSVVFKDKHVCDYVTMLEHELGVPVSYVTTGPQTCHMLQVKHGMQAAAKKEKFSATATAGVVGDEE